MTIKRIAGIRSRLPFLLLLLGLTVAVPPHVHATAQHDVILDTLERHLVLTEVENGYTYADLNDAGFQGLVAREDIDASTYTILNSDPDDFKADIATPNGAGGANDFGVRGSFSEYGGFVGTLALENSTLIPVNIPSVHGAAAAIITVIIILLIVAALLCVIGNFYTECQAACREACDGALRSCEELWCGRCKSECYEQ